MPRMTPEELAAARAAKAEVPQKKVESAPAPKPAVSTPSYDAEITAPAAEESVTRKVKLDLEVDTSVKDLGVNPYANWIHMARAVDSWRIFPRIFISTYIYLLYKVVLWYMAIPSPTMEQSGLVSIVVGAGAAWFGLYTGSSKSNK